MLTPEQLAAIGDYFLKLFEDYEDAVIRDIARRLSKTGELTETAQLQIMRLMELGESRDEIARLTAELLDLSDKTVAELMQYAAEQSTDFREAVFDRAGTTQQEILGNAQTQRMLEAAISQTQNEMRNITRSMGFRGRDGVWRSCAQAYQRALDSATLQVSTGTMSYQQAIRSAVRELADAGMSYVDYASGWVNRADVAVRRACLTGVSQLTGELSVQNAKTLDTDYVEVTAHMGARPEHAVWQGKVYKLEGSEPGYPNLAASTGYGTGPGLKGWNCRHDFYPFFPGIDERAYTDEDLRNIDPPPFTYDGRTYSAYEASQYQRKMETSMRKTKRRIIAADGAGLSDDFTAESIKLRRQREMYRDFSRKAHLPTQEDRIQVLGFGHSMSSKAVWAERNATVAKYQGYLGTKSYSATLRKLSEIEYNNDKWLLDGFVQAVDKGDISVLVGIDEYINTARKIEQQLVGLTTKDGVVIKGYVTHFVDRIIGQTAEPHPGMRQGISLNTVKSALLNSDNILDTIHKSGAISRRYQSGFANVTVNPTSGKIVQANRKRG